MNKSKIDTTQKNSVMKQVFKPQFLYHISANDVERTQSILKHGLKCNEEGHIFLFENMIITMKGSTVINSVADCIAFEQIFLENYTMYEIDMRGISAELISDNVSECSSICQWYVCQERINQKYISVYGCYETDFSSF